MGTLQTVVEGIRWVFTKLTHKNHKLNEPNFQKIEQVCEQILLEIRRLSVEMKEHHSTENPSGQ